MSGAITDNQRFHLLLADIAMAAAIRGCGSVVPAIAGDHAPGAIRDLWLAEERDEALKKRVVALANAGVASLQNLDADRLLKVASASGVPVDAVLAERIVEHFTARREAFLSYRR